MKRLVVVLFNTDDDLIAGERYLKKHAKGSTFRLVPAAMRDHAKAPHIVRPKTISHLRTWLRSSQRRAAPTSFLLALAPDYDLHHQTIAALASMNLRLHNLLSAGLDQIFVLDREQRMVAFFGHWPKESPWALEELLGKRKRDVFGADKAAIHEAATLRALKGEEVSYEWTVKDKVRLTYLFTTASPLRTDAGVVTGVLLVTRNVTPLKQEQLAIQQALREKTDQLAEVELSVKRIAATLRPPASAVEPASTSRLHTNAFLSKREREVLSLLQRGLRPRTIAQTLGLSVETVRHNVKTMFRKTGVHSQEALVRLFSDPVDRRGQAERSRGA